MHVLALTRSCPASKYGDGYNHGSRGKINEDRLKLHEIIMRNIKIRRLAKKKKCRSNFHLPSSKFPWRIGDIVEMKTQEIGYRGAWFRVEIKNVRQVKNGKLYSTVIYKDFPDESEEEIVAINIDPLTKRSALMIRPLPPPAIKECAYDETQQHNTSHAILRDYWEVGDLVDWWYNDCWWLAEVLVVLGEGHFQVKCPSPPEGEGGVYLAKESDMRASLNWSLEEQWTAPPSKVDGMKQCARLVGTVLHPDVVTTKGQEPDGLIDHEKHLQISNSEDNTQKLFKDDTNKNKDFNEKNFMSRLEHKLPLESEKQLLAKPLGSFKNLENEFEEMFHTEKHSMVNADENTSEQDSIKCINEEETFEKLRAKTEIQDEHCLIDQIKQKQRTRMKVVGQSGRSEHQRKARIKMGSESTPEQATLTSKRHKGLKQKSFNGGELTYKQQMLITDGRVEVLENKISRSSDHGNKKSPRQRTEECGQFPHIQQIMLENRILNSMKVKSEQTSRMGILADVGKQEAHQSITDKKKRKCLWENVPKESKCAEHICNDHHLKIIEKGKHFEEEERGFETCANVYSEKIEMTNEVNIQPSTKTPKGDKKRRLELNMVQEAKSEGLVATQQEQVIGLNSMELNMVQEVKSEGVIASQQEQVTDEAVTSMCARPTLRDFGLHKGERENYKVFVNDAHKLKGQEDSLRLSEQQKADTSKTATMNSILKLEVPNATAQAQASTEQDLRILRDSKSKGHTLSSEPCKIPKRDKKRRLELKLVKEVKSDGVVATQEEQVIGDVISSMCAGTTLRDFGLHEDERENRTAFVKDVELRAPANQLKVQGDFPRRSKQQKADTTKRATMKSVSQIEVPNEIAQAKASSKQDLRLLRKSISKGHALSLQPCKSPKGNRKIRMELNMVQEVRSDGVAPTQEEQVTGDAMTSIYTSSNIQDFGLHESERKNHQVFINDTGLRVCAKQLKTQEKFPRRPEQQKANTVKRKTMKSVSNIEVPNGIGQAKGSSEQDLRTSPESKSKGHPLSSQPCKNPKGNKKRRLELNTVVEVKSDGVLAATQEEQVTGEVMTSKYVPSNLQNTTVQDLHVSDNGVFVDDAELRVCAKQLKLQEKFPIRAEQQKADTAKRATMESASTMEVINELAQAKASSKKDLKKSKSKGHALSLQSCKNSKGNKKRRLELNMVHAVKSNGVATQEEQVIGHGEAMTSKCGQTIPRDFGLHEGERENLVVLVNDAELCICANELNVQEDISRRSEQQKTDTVKKGTMKSVPKMKGSNVIAQAKASSEQELRILRESKYTGHALPLQNNDKRLELSAVPHGHEKTNDVECEEVSEDKYVIHERPKEFSQRQLEKIAHMSTNSIHDAVLEWDLEDADKPVNSDDLHISVCGSLASVSEGVCLSSGVLEENVHTNNDTISTDELDADSCSAKFTCARERPAQDNAPDPSDRRDFMIEPNTAHMVDYSRVRKIIDKPVIKYKIVLSRKLVSTARRELWSNKKPLSKCKTF